MSKAIRIEEYNDGYAIFIDGTIVCGIGQEDASDGLVKVFKALGFDNVTYEEVY